MSLDDSVRTLKQPTTFAGLSTRVEDEIERAYWEMLRQQDRTQVTVVKSERDAFKDALRQMFLRLRDGSHTND